MFVGETGVATRSPEGRPISREEWEAKKDEWVPSPADDAYVLSLMQKPIYDPNQMANWIAAPPRGIKGQPVNYAYVRHEA
jgi:benzoyl-CoA 2,3-dioxygenase component B